MVQLLLIFFSISFILLQVSANNNIEQLWSEHKINYNLKFSQLEDDQRSEIFSDNLKYIEKHNLMPSTFKLGMNMFGHLTHGEYLEYVQNGMNYKNVRRPKRATPSEFVETFADIDWRTKKVVTDVQNQGNCGSCWAFSATGSLEGQMALKQKKLIKLSEQELVDCSKTYGNEGCNGGLMDRAFKYVKSQGISNSSYYPYTAKNGICHHVDSAVVLKIKNMKTYEDKNETNLSNFISKVGPISVAMDASDRKFTFYKSGVYESSTCSSEDINHGILAVGLGSKPSIHYILKNSWGKGWGQDGYFLLARNMHNMCGIATYYTFPLL